MSGSPGRNPLRWNCMARLLDVAACRNSAALILSSILMISILVNCEMALRHFTGMNVRPGSLARRYQQIAVAIFHAEVGAAGSDITPVQYAALVELRRIRASTRRRWRGSSPSTGRPSAASSTGSRRKACSATSARRIGGARARNHREGNALLDHVEPAVMAAQRLMLAGLDAREATEFLRLLSKAVEAGNALSRAPLQGAGPL